MLLYEWPLRFDLVFHIVVLISPIDLFVVIGWTLIKLSYLIVSSKAMMDLLNRLKNHNPIIDF
jgi:hypothetical protein